MKLQESRYPLGTQRPQSKKIGMLE